jgi:hypothetical protein
MMCTSHDSSCHISECGSECFGNLDRDALTKGFKACLVGISQPVWLVGAVLQAGNEEGAEVVGADSGVTVQA